jgi:uncharacterized protein (UPF0297 family)
MNMHTNEFREAYDKAVEHETEVLFSKSKLYAKNGDVFQNFRHAASLSQETPEKALMGMATKHVINVYTMVGYINSGDPKLLPDPKNFNESICDVRNYLILLEALYQERMSKGVPEHMVPRSKITELIESVEL